MLDMNPSGSFRLAVSPVYVLLSLSGGRCRKSVGTYKDNRNNSEYQDGAALPHSLLSLLDRLPCLDDRGLLLLEPHKILQLEMAMELTFWQAEKGSR